jgi:hypothetical protein
MKRKNMMKTGLLGLAAALSIGVAANPAVAALGSFPLTGGDHHVTSNVMESAAAKSVSRASQTTATPPASAAYSVNVVTLASGTIVREFVATSSNAVFAVAWSGPRPPNFVDILGTYAERYLKPTGSDAIRVGGLSQRGLNSSDLVVQSFGHFGRFNGYAYLPSAVPAGFPFPNLK